MGNTIGRALRTTIPLAALVAIGCGEETDPGTGGTGADDDGSVASGPDDPPLTAADCPTTPTNLALTPVAPFYGGLMQLTFNSSGKGIPGYQDVQLFDPALGVYTWSGGNVSQREDGSFLALVTPQVNEHNKDGGFKIRVRSQLTGCAPSEWAVSETFALENPFADTTWTATFDPIDVYDYLSFGLGSGTGTTTGPYSLAQDPPLRHELAFHADGTLDEKIAFGIASETAGDLYAGCKFQIALQGTWEISYEGNVVLRMSPRHVVSTAGSTCTNPPVGEIRLTSDDVTLDGAVSPTYSLSYSELFYSPPGKPRWTGPSFSSTLSSVFTHLNDAVGPDTSYSQGSVNVNNGFYEKQ